MILMNTSAGQEWRQTENRFVDTGGEGEVG